MLKLMDDIISFKKYLYTAKIVFKHGQNCVEDKEQTRRMK